MYSRRWRNKTFYSPRESGSIDSSSGRPGQYYMASIWFQKIHSERTSVNLPKKYNNRMTRFLQMSPCWLQAIEWIPWLTCHTVKYRQLYISLFWESTAITLKWGINQETIIQRGEQAASKVPRKQCLRRPQRSCATMSPLSKKHKGWLCPERWETT